MKLIRICALLLLSLFFVFGSFAILEPSQGTPIHTGWLVGYLTALTTSLLLLVREFRQAPRPSGKQT